MKFLPTTAALLLWVPWAALADEKPSDDTFAKHREGSSKIADRQDELSADVQQLTIEQTMPQVIELLGQVKKIMDEATDKLAEADTGGLTLAAETEIIEKIHDAAKEKQKSGGGKSGGAMMDMMERMMGEGEGDKKGKGKGKGKGEGEGEGEGGDQGGKGKTGLSDAANEGVGGTTSGKSEARRVPKASGSAGHALPEEFRKALDAYNRGAEKKVK